MKGAYRQAIEDLTKAIEIDRNCSLVYFNRALCYHSNGELQEALRDYTIVLMVAGLAASSDSSDGGAKGPLGAAGPGPAGTGAKASAATELSIGDRNDPNFADHARDQMIYFKVCTSNYLYF